MGGGSVNRKRERRDVPNPEICGASKNILFCKGAVILDVTVELWEKLWVGGLPPNPPFPNPLQVCVA